MAPLVQGSDGNFYGTTTTGGNANGTGNGTIFKFTPGSPPTTLHLINPAADGSYSIGALVQGPDGNLYGTMSAAGDPTDPDAGGGTAFEISSAGVYQVIHRFTPSSSDGGTPGGLFLANDGNFYGTLGTGGLDAVGDNPGNGAIFRLTPSGNESIIWFFKGQSDGSGPDSALVQGENGSLWGTNSDGGANGNGVIFEVSPDGAAFTAEYSYGVYSDGTQEPHIPGLIVGPDQLLYGTLPGLQTETPQDLGSVYQISPATGVFATAYTFAFVNAGTQSNLSNGAEPSALPVLGKDGNLYGITAGGGSSYLEDQNGGTIYQLTAGGHLTTLYTFPPSLSQLSRSSLIQGADGQFYGTTCGEGSNGVGSIYRISVQ